MVVVVMVVMIDDGGDGGDDDGGGDVGGGGDDDGGDGGDDDGGDGDNDDGGGDDDGNGDDDISGGDGGLKEIELCDEQEQLQRKLRLIRKEQRNVNQVDRARKEKPCLHDILNVIEKRDLLLLELEIERRRDDDETQKLKSIFKDQSKTVRSQKVDYNKSRNLSYKNSQDGQCVIL
ncbi:Hypothetical predicted protein [Paramuricea clavata]|uniref:Uncharacterized protein n=1 Tax=Paramuricea clavata TaxID=317549 RepID=A0A6S7KF35_PARCT|nr:Hypothetical predicted protein [Paramuricea clavata]